MWHSFQSLGDIVAERDSVEDKEVTGRKIDSQIYIDITTSFTILIGIFFPSVTGKRKLTYSTYLAGVSY